MTSLRRWAVSRSPLYTLAADGWRGLHGDGGHSPTPTDPHACPIRCAGHDTPALHWAVLLFRKVEDSAGLAMIARLI